jgi:hypothetical protein
LIEPPQSAIVAGSHMNAEVANASRALAAQPFIPAALACAQQPVPASGTWNPDLPICFVVGFPPGGSTDTTAWALAQGITAGLGQPVVAENCTGAAGNIAIKHVARSAPGGHTWIPPQAERTRPEEFGVECVPEAAVRALIATHHYVGDGLPPVRSVVGHFRKIGPCATARVAGVAVFSQSRRRDLVPGARLPPAVGEEAFGLQP